MDYKFLSLGVRVIWNANSLNGAGNVGNTTTLQKMPVILRTDEGYYVAMVPAVTGNAIKHHHTVLTAYEAVNDGMKNLISKLDYEKQRRYPDKSLPEYGYLVNKGKKGGDVRIITLDGSEIVIPLGKTHEIEEEFVKNLVIADLHGFLFPLSSYSVPRESTLKFSFALPVEEVVAEYSNMLRERIVHNRVRPAEEKGSEGTSGQMLFYRYYASAIYGFRIDFDIDRVSRLYSAPYLDPVVDGDQRKLRIKRAIDAMADYLYYPRGANISRALPVSQIEELAILLAKRPIGLPHPYYKNRRDTAMGLLDTFDDVRIIAYGEDRKEHDKITLVNSPAEAFREAKKVLGI